MHVFTGLQKLFKAKKAYIREEEHAEGYGKVSRGRISSTERGDEEGPDRSVIRARWGWGDGMCRKKRLARKLSRNGEITYHIHGHRPLGAIKEE